MAKLPPDGNSTVVSALLTASAGTDKAAVVVVPQQLGLLRLFQVVVDGRHIGAAEMEWKRKLLTERTYEIGVGLGCGAADSVIASALGGVRGRAGALADVESLRKTAAGGARATFPGIFSPGSARRCDVRSARRAGSALRSRGKASQAVAGGGSDWPARCCWVDSERDQAPSRDGDS